MSSFRCHCRYSHCFIYRRHDFACRLARRPFCFIYADTAADAAATLLRHFRCRSSRRRYATLERRSRHALIWLRLCRVFRHAATQSALALR